jgi:hypothetical protein
MVFGIFGLGVLEMAVIGALAGAMIGVLVYLFSASGKDDK